MHQDERPAHHHVAYDGGQHDDRVHTCVHEIESGHRGLVVLPVDEAPRPRLLERHLAEPQAGQRAEHEVGDVHGQESERGEFLVHVLVVEIRVVDRQVSLHWHREHNAELHQEEEEQDEAGVLAQRLAPGPGALHVGGDGDRAGQQGAQQVRHRQAAHERVESRLFLLLAGYPQNHDGDDVPHHPENEHDRWDGGRLKSCRRCLGVHASAGEGLSLSPHTEPGLSSRVRGSDTFQ